MTTRREFMKDAGLLGAASFVAIPSARALTPAAPVTPAAAQAGMARIPDIPSGSPAELAQDETYWRRIADLYRVTDAVTNLEAGYFGMMATPVLEAYHRHIDRVNRESSYFVRREYPAILEQARARVAAFVGARPSELALSRGATEALQALISQYNRVGSGDVVMYADLDYNAMQWAMNGLAERRGARVARLDIPEPASKEAVLAAYATALDANPRTRLLLLTHCNNKTGLILPVREIVAMARARGADVVVDAAHSFGQVPLSMDDLGADFVGMNLHKWLGAPVGAGALYIRDGRLDAIDRAHADESAPADHIDSRIHTGTTHFATVMTIPDALDFQIGIGMPNKAARLRYLRDHWVRAARAVDGIDILTPDDPQSVGAITSFRVRGRTSREANQKLVGTLLDEFGLFTYWRTGLARGDCVRVTPTLYNTPADADRLVAALRTIAARA